MNIPASAMLAEDGSEVDFDLETLLRSEDGIRMLTEGVHASYARMPFGNPAYRALFGAIRAGQTPILFHCTAGKDRTGAVSYTHLTSCPYKFRAGCFCAAGAGNRAFRR